MKLHGIVFILFFIYSCTNKQQQPVVSHCNQDTCLKVASQLEVLSEGYFPPTSFSETELQLILDSLVKDYKKTAEYLNSNIRYQHRSAQFENNLRKWNSLSPDEHANNLKPVPPVDPFEIKLKQLRENADYIGKPKAHQKMIGDLRIKLDSCRCDIEGFGKPTKVFDDSNRVSNDVRKVLTNFSDTVRWMTIRNNMGGVMGSEFNGNQEIGTAAVEREFKGSGLATMLDLLGGSNINFWYPQLRKGENKSYKQTLCGTVSNAYKMELQDILPDQDLNIEITPSKEFSYLITEAHKPDFTTITRLGQQHNGEQPGCPVKFSTMEAEIDTRISAKELLLKKLLTRTGEKISVYGAWVYDKGHCCKPEIHPAEQIWWAEADSAINLNYYCNIFCDASARFWYTSRMDGNIIKPWAEPPVKGVFAIPFEVTIGYPAKLYTIAISDSLNVNHYAGGNRSFNLVYANQTLVSVNPGSDAFKISFANVGLVGKDRIRGYMIIEASVGKLIQQTTSIQVPNPDDPEHPRIIQITEAADPSTVNQHYRDRFFKKMDGHLMFRVTRSYL